MRALAEVSFPTPEAVPMPSVPAPVLTLALVLLPMCIAAALWLWRLPNRLEQGALALATLWNAVTLVAVNRLADAIGWWRFDVDSLQDPQGVDLLGLPLPIWLGWTIFWGIALPLLPMAPSGAIGVALLVDLLYMPMLGPLVHLGSSWLIGEVVLLGVVAVPGLVLHRGLVQRKWLLARTLLQLTLFALLLVWFIPALAVDALGGSLAPTIPWPVFGVAVGVFGVAALPGITAVHEFHLAGGTPWPWDTTERLVRSGPYRFLRSPMQLSALLVLSATAAVAGEPVVIVAVVVGFGYAVLFSGLEERELAERFGRPWVDGNRGQPRWLPTLRPAPHSEPARIWVDMACGVCRPVGSFLEARSPVNLKIVDATDHPEQLDRVRYERADGQAWNGVAAVGAALEHLHLGWAMVGWTLRLPLLSRIWQFIGDGVGFGPRPVGSDASSTSSPV